MHLKTLLAATITLATLTAAKREAPGRACGFKIAPCPEDQYCKPDSPKCIDLNKCQGTCAFRNTYPNCGGFRSGPPLKCKHNATCQDDPRLPDSCGQACDMPGICVPKNTPSCGGFAGTKCPKGLFCYDVPGDTCDPDKGGADCAGICL